MRFSSVIYVILILFLCSNISHAENWINVTSNDKNIYLDTDSITVNNESLYYNVKYYEEKAGKDIVVTIQSKNNYAGIISTCKLSEYNKNKNLANTKTSKIAKKFNKLTPTSMLYKANEKANSFENYEEDYSENNSTDYADEDDTYSTKPNDNKSGIDAIKEPDFGPWMREFQRRVKNNWNPPKGDESRQVVLLIKIAKDGRLLSFSVKKSSGLQNADSAAISAVKLAAPFRPLPAEYKNSSIDIVFTFDYNVFRE